MAVAIIDGEVYAIASLVEQHVGRLLAEVGFLARLEALVAIFPRHQPGQFANFFGQARHVGQFAEVADAVLAYPLVDGALRLT